MKVYVFTESTVDNRAVLITPYKRVFKRKEDAIACYEAEINLLKQNGYEWKRNANVYGFEIMSDYYNNQNKTRVRITVDEKEVE